MSFEAILQEMIDGCPGAMGIALMGTDGIPIAQVEAESTGPLGLADVGSAGVEFGRILDEIRKASDTLGGGSLSEAVVGLQRYWLLFRVVDEELFLVTVLAPHGNLGKGRYLQRRHLHALREQL